MPFDGKKIIQQDYPIIMIGSVWQNLKKIMVKTCRQRCFWQVFEKTASVPPFFISHIAGTVPGDPSGNILPAPNSEMPIKTLLRRKRGVEKPAQKGCKRIIV